MPVIPSSDNWQVAAVSLLAVGADGLHGASSHRFVGEALFLFVFRLLENIAVTAIVITSEIGGRSFAAQVTVDALIIHVEFTGGVLGILVGDVCHDAWVFFELARKD